MNGLMAHCDTDRVTEAEVKAVPSPDFTDTWHPVSHGQVIEALETACIDRGLGIKSKAYSLNTTGTRMFGVWSLDAGTKDAGYALGLRNSLDKSMQVGICAGTNVFVCDNMCFSGDYIAFRKHTSGLDMDELMEIGYRAVGGTIIEMEKMVAWQDGMHEIYVPANDRKAMVYDMMETGIFSPSNFKKFGQCFDEEKAVRRGRKLDGAASLYNVHGAATRMMREWNLLRVAEATKKLNNLCDDYMTARVVN